METTRIAQERKKLGLNQEELAAKVGVSQKSISKYERGTRRPNYETLTAMAKLFNVSVDYLLGTDNEMFTDESDFISEDEYALVHLYREFQKDELKEQQLKKLQDYFGKSLIISSNYEKKIIDSFRMLNEDNQDIIIGKAKELLREQRYEESINVTTSLREAK